MHVRFLVGRNGVGKSQYLIDAAKQHNSDSIFVCNTVHDRSASLRKIKRFSAKNPSSRPNNIIKSIIKRLLTEGPHRLNQVERVLIHCGYQPRITVEIDSGNISRSPSEIAKLAFDKSDEEYLQNIDSYSRNKVYEISFGESRSYFELSGLAFLLDDEMMMRRRGSIGLLKISLYKQNGQQIPLLKASSGELSLITSMMFILSEIENKHLILIDEPENSLHPRWQREYIPMLYDLLGYHDAEIIIATHSPLIVTGALLDSRISSDIYHPETGRVELAASTNIEGLLWEEFETIPPASRFLSEKLVEQLEDLSTGHSSLTQTLDFIKKANNASFDDKQKQLFVAAEELARKIIKEHGNAS